MLFKVELTQEEGGFIEQLKSDRELNSKVAAGIDKQAQSSGILVAAKV